MKNNKNALRRQRTVKQFTIFGVHTIMLDTKDNIQNFAKYILAMMMMVMMMVNEWNDTVNK